MLPRYMVRTGLESIDFQSGELHAELTAVIATCRKERDVAAAIDRSDIPGIVKKHTGCTITINVAEDMSENAAVNIPPIDRNSPLFDYHEVAWFDASLGTKAVRLAGEPIKGNIDLKTGMFTGYFSEIVAPIYITRGLVENDYFTPGEAAAILEHEVGHFASYLEYLGYTYRTNRIMTSTISAFFGIGDFKQREVILKTYEDVSGTHLEDIEALSKSTDGGALQLVLLHSFILKRRNEVGAKVYDKRTFEQLADEFAGRHGAARDLATAMHKMYRMDGSTAVESLWDYAVAEVWNAISFLFVPFAMMFTIAGIITVLKFFCFIASDPSGNVYDDPIQRIANMRRHLVELLKSPVTSADQKKRALADIESIKEIESEMNNRRHFYEFVWTTLFTKQRIGYNQVRLQKELEEMAANNLYVAAAKLQAIPKGE